MGPTVKSKIKGIAASAVVAAVAVLAGCGGTAHPQAAAVTHHHAATLSAAQRAVNRAATLECNRAQPIYNSVNSATTIADLNADSGRWQSQLTAAEGIPERVPGVPKGHNIARELAVDYAEAAFALALADAHADPFGSHFSARIVKRGYNMALSKLQDALNRCAAR